MFFEPIPAEEEQARRGLPEPSPWAAPPTLETGALVATERTVARSANVAVVMPVIRAFSAGCMFDVEVIMRQGTLSEDDWWDLRLSSHGGPFRSRGGRLPDKLLRLGVRYADGTKATTVAEPMRQRGGGGDPPAGPVLSWWPGSSGVRGRDFGFSGFGLWLWPLPPAETFEFAVEWPYAGIDLTITELEVAPIVAAADRSGYYWPDFDSPAN